MATPRQADATKRRHSSDPPQGEAVLHRQRCVRPVEFATPGKFIEVAGGDVWDITLLSPDPARARVADWTTPVFELDYTYLVPPNSKLTTSAEADRAGVRVGAVRGGSQELVVTRILKNSEAV